MTVQALLYYTYPDWPKLELWKVFLSFFFVLAEPSNKQKYLLVVFKSRLFYFVYLILFFCFIVVVKHLPKHGQLGVVYATSSPLLWDQEKAGKTSELCKDYQVYGVKVICLVWL